MVTGISGISVQCGTVHRRTSSEVDITRLSADNHPHLRRLLVRSLFTANISTRFSSRHGSKLLLCFRFRFFSYLPFPSFLIVNSAISYVCGMLSFRKYSGCRKTLFLPYFHNHFCLHIFR